MDRTFPGGRVIGIDILPTQPPKGVSTIQGNFLSESVQNEVKNFLHDPNKGARSQQQLPTIEDDLQAYTEDTEEALEKLKTGYIRQGTQVNSAPPGRVEPKILQHKGRKQMGDAEGRMVDVVLSDMSAPWEQTTGFWKRSLSDPYFRMMNTSGISFRDHARSMVRQDQRSSTCCSIF